MTTPKQGVYERGAHCVLCCVLVLTVPLSLSFRILLQGGSGGALGIGMGNSVGMLSGGYFGVISPEGAASILGR